jgi:hypothetical protein
VRSLLEDNDLGILRIRDQPQLPVQAALPAAKIGFFSARLSVASSDNILLAVNDASELTGDTFLRPSIAFGVYPALGPQTAFIATRRPGATALQRPIEPQLRRLAVSGGATPGPKSPQLWAAYIHLPRAIPPGGQSRTFFSKIAPWG